MELGRLAFVLFTDGRRRFGSEELGGVWGAADLPPRSDDANYESQNS